MGSMRGSAHQELAHQYFQYFSNFLKAFTPFSPTSPYFCRFKKHPAFSSDVLRLNTTSIFLQLSIIDNNINKGENKKEKKCLPH